MRHSLAFPLLLILWAGWLLLMVSFSFQKLPIWIALDSISRPGLNLELEASVPVRDKSLIRIATTTPGITPPAAIPVKGGRFKTQIPLPANNAQIHGLHLWSALPAGNKMPQAISNGTIAILDPDVLWILEPTVKVPG